MVLNLVSLTRVLDDFDISGVICLNINVVYIYKYFYLINWIEYSIGFLPRSLGASLSKAYTVTHT